MQISSYNTCTLTWSEEDNPNGWIEPTTACQLKCPGCYRGVDKKGHQQIHREIEEMKSEIDWMISNRNIHTLSVAGGEPLLYPHLDEMVKYAYGLGLRIMIYTNGIGLDSERLSELKKSGVTTFLIHIDKFQGRTKTESLEEILALRSDYCDLFRRETGVNLGFIQPLTLSCLEDLQQVHRFFDENRDIISLVVHTLYREICWNHDNKPIIDTSLSISSVIEKLNNTGSFKPAALLESTIANEPSWVFSYSIGSANKNYGFLDGKVYDMIQRRYYQKNGRYLFISRKSEVKTTGLLKLIKFASIFKTLFRMTMNGTIRGEKYLQTILVIRGPILTGDRWDLCKGCPDAMLYKGKLVPSCILEEIKLNKHLT